MDKEKLHELLDTIYELEALVHLAMEREDYKRDLERLIKRKAQLIVSKTEGKEEHVDPVVPKYVNEKSRMEPSVNKTADNMHPEKMKDETDISEEEENDTAEKIEEAQPKGKLVFSVNDRFRFKRELFANSDADFNNTLAIVASMENFEEAEDYFLNELAMDESHPAVVDFLEIIRKYFS